MQKLFEDLWTEIQGYYEGMITLLPKLILGFLILFIFILLGKKIKKHARAILVTRMDDPLLANFLSKILQVVNFVIGFFIFLNIVGLGTTANGLLASAGVGAFAIGFAFKDLGENFIAGIMLAFNRPFKVGDVVALDGVKGNVVALSLRNVQIKTSDGVDIFVPSANIIKNPLLNYTIDGDLRFDFTIGLDYGADMSAAIKLILDTLVGIPGIMHDLRQPFVMVSKLSPSTIDLTVYYWIDAFDTSISGSNIKNQAVEKVLAAFNEAGYYLPGDILELKNYSDADLTMSMVSASEEKDSEQI